MLTQKFEKRKEAGGFWCSLGGEGRLGEAARDLRMVEQLKLVGFVMWTADVVSGSMRSEDGRK